MIPFVSKYQRNGHWDLSWDIPLQKIHPPMSFPAFPCASSRRKKHASQLLLWPSSASSGLVFSWRPREATLWSTWRAEQETGKMVREMEDVLRYLNYLKMPFTRYLKICTYIYIYTHTHPKNNVACHPQKKMNWMGQVREIRPKSGCFLTWQCNLKM